MFDDAVTKLNINGLQHYYVLDEMQKIDTLTEFLNILQMSKSLIFVDSMEKGHMLKEYLSFFGIKGVSTDEKEFPNEKVIFTDYSFSNLPE